MPRRQPMLVLGLAPLAQRACSMSGRRCNMGLAASRWRVVGMGYSQHAGMVIVADGTEAAQPKRLARRSRQTTQRLGCDCGNADAGLLKPRRQDPHARPGD